MLPLSLFRIAGAAALVLGLSACASMSSVENIKRTTEQVTPITVGDAASVSAYVLASAMLRAGFTGDEIVKRGPAVRNALATSGGAQIRDGNMVLALFSVHDDLLYISSRTNGTFTMRIEG
ncbi:MAG TPA: hypothetical protein VFE52_01995 [Devosia sp.]|jgi:hypothetical protein|nr:hypothetical protein [Devosia sp.]